MRGSESAAPSFVADSGWRAFGRIWLGQSVSLIGSRLTSFALGVWVYQKTGSISLFSLITFFAMLPGVALSPVAGILVDRFDRRVVMMVSDSGAALATLVLMGLLWTEGLALWHIYLIVSMISVMSAVQFPAYSAATTMLLPREHLGRASGMVQFARSGADVLGLSLGGLLLARIGIVGVTAIDLSTFLFAALTLLLVRVPRPPSAAGPASGSFVFELTSGWRYVRQRPGLLRLLVYFAAMNSLVSFALVLPTPLVLSFTTVEELGFVLGAGAVGALVGSLGMSLWGGPKRRIHGILGASPIIALGFLVAGSGRSSAVVTAGLFLLFAAVPVVNACSQAIWQSQVAPEVQGRVFAFRRMVAQLTGPISVLVAGPLAEHFFEPLLLEGGPLTASVGLLLGIGPGRGIGLMLVIAGLLFFAITAWGCTQPSLLRIDEMANVGDMIETRS